MKKIAARWYAVQVCDATVLPDAVLPVAKNINQLNVHTNRYSKRCRCGNR